MSVKFIVSLISVSYVFWVLIPTVLFCRMSGQTKLLSGRRAEGRHQLVQPSDYLHSLLDLISVNLYVSQVKLAKNFFCLKNAVMPRRAQA